jgi:hypothetical protein
MRQVHISLGAFPCKRFDDAIGLAMNGVSEPLLGELSTQHLQLCPQNFGVLTEEMALNYRQTPMQFRLHANVRVLKEMRFADFSNFDQHQDWFIQAGKISRLLGAPAYTGHAGERQFTNSLEQVFDHVRAAQDIFECPVGVEALYPDRKNPLKYWISTWEEYAKMLHSGVHYALDLSHLNIVAHHTGRKELSLVGELLASDRCLEVHLSHNDGTGDSHLPMIEPPWWFDLLEMTHQDATIFSEGSQHPSAKVKL